MLKLSCYCPHTSKTQQVSIAYQYKINLYHLHPIQMLLSSFSPFQTIHMTHILSQGKNLAAMFFQKIL